MCPYCQAAKIEVQNWNQNPNEEQVLTEGRTVTRTVYTYVECKREKCGAFYDGVCHYNSN